MTDSFVSNVLTNVIINEQYRIGCGNVNIKYQGSNDDNNNNSLVVVKVWSTSRSFKEHSTHYSILSGMILAQYFMKVLCLLDYDVLTKM